MPHPLSRRPLLAALPLLSLMTATATRAQGALTNVERRSFTAKSFRLENGTVMPEITLAYETYGTLAPDGRKPSC